MDDGRGNRTKQPAASKRDRHAVEAEGKEQDVLADHLRGPARQTDGLRECRHRVTQQHDRAHAAGRADAAAATCMAVGRGGWCRRR